MVRPRGGGSLDRRERENDDEVEEVSTTIVADVFLVASVRT